MSHIAKVADAIAITVLGTLCGVFPIVQISYAVVRGCMLIDWSGVMR